MTEYAITSHTGVDGVATNIVLNSQSWELPIDNIKTEVHLWSGTNDANTPPAMTAFYSTVLPNSQPFIRQDEGHYALYAHWEEMLERLV